MQPQARATIARSTSSRPSPPTLGTGYHPESTTMFRDVRRNMRRAICCRKRELDTALYCDVQQRRQIQSLMLISISDRCSLEHVLFSRRVWMEWYRKGKWELWSRSIEVLYRKPAMRKQHENKIPRSRHLKHTRFHQSISNRRLNSLVFFDPFLRLSYLR